MLVTISFDGHFKAWLLADHSDTKGKWLFSITEPEGLPFWSWRPASYCSLTHDSANQGIDDELNHIDALILSSAFPFSLCR